MIELGLIGLGSTHAQTIARNVTEMDDASIKSVYDSGDFRNKNFLKSFCEKFNSTEVNSAEEMIPHVDAVLILNVNWEEHIKFAKEFLQAKKPVLIDKPVSGSYAQLIDLKNIAERYKTPIFGGSAIVHHPKIQKLKIEHDSRVIHSVTYNDPFHYAPHIIDTTRAIIGSDWSEVKPLQISTNCVSAEFEDGSCATFHLSGPHRGSEFVFMDISEKTNIVTIDDMLPDGKESVRDTVYTNYVEEFLSLIEGQSNSAGYILDAAILVLACHASIDQDETIKPNSTALKETDISSGSYMSTYTPYY